MGNYRVTDRHGKRHTLKSVWYTAPTIASLRPRFDADRQEHMHKAYNAWLESTGRAGPLDPRSDTHDPRPPYVTEGEPHARYKVTMGYGARAWTLYSDWYRGQPPISVLSCAAGALPMTNPPGGL